MGSGSSTGEHFLSIGNNFNIFLTLRSYENCAWAPSLLVFIVATGTGGKHFVDTPSAPATAAQIFSFAATIAGFMMTWSAFSSDYTAYFHPRVSRYVEFRLGLHQNLISRKLVGEFSYTRISASIFLS